MGVSVGVSSNGNSASGGYYVGIYASSSPYITTSSVCLKTVLRPSVNGCSSQSWTESVSVPLTMTGTYYIGVIADPWNYITETNKGNNARAAYNTTTISAPAIAWGNMVPSAFKTKVLQVASDLQINPNYLMAVMDFESAGSFSPSKPGAYGAVGLIQFTTQGISNLQTTLAALQNMTAVQQLDYVERYLSPYAGRLNTLSDLYMAVLWPGAVGAPDDTTLFSRGSVYYAENSGLDLNGDGLVTKSEATSFVENRLLQGLGSPYFG